MGRLSEPRSSGERGEAHTRQLNTSVQGGATRYGEAGGGVCLPLTVTEEESRSQNNTTGCNVISSELTQLNLLRMF